MSISGNNILAGASGNQGFEIERSLRFNDDDSAYLNRTPSSAGNRKTWTWSGWVKKSKLTAYQGLFSAGNSAANYTAFRFQNDDQLVFFMSNATVANVETTQVFRDVSAWHHIVLALDTTQATAANRVKIYVNGSQVTDFSSSSYPTQNTDGTINNAIKHVIGTTHTTVPTLYLDGYLAEVNFIDGQALAPSDFGETDSDTGAWIPKKYSGSYGTNGFYLNFSDNSGVTATTLGKDSSGNGNNFTPNNFSVTAGTGNDSLEDTPTNNWCTINPLDGPTSTTLTYTEGNLTSESTSTSARNLVNGTFGVTSGKWYWELTVDNSNGRCIVGVALADANRNEYVGQDASSWGIYQLTGDKYHNGTGASYGSSWLTAGDVLQIALDVDNSKIWFGKNGTYFASGDPAAGTNAAYTNVTGGALFPSVGDGSSGGVYKATYNFGQRAFAYTPPTGFKSLNTQNLPVPTIKKGSKYFDSKLWTATGTDPLPVTGLEFSPDLVWAKARNDGYNHVLVDQVRGVNNVLSSNLTNAESSVTTVTQFNSDGFNAGGTANNNYSLNCTVSAARTYVAWNWDAGSNSSKTFTVKVVSDSGNKYRFDDFGTSAVTLDLEEGSTYVFDQSDSSNSGHPLRFSTTSDGTHGSGSEYTTGVTTTGTPGSAGAKTTIVVAASAPTLYYYCSAHSGMGGQANTNSTAGASNFDGNIQSTVRVNAEAGFSIVRYTGNGTDANSNTVTVGHGLGVKPDVIITKKITSGTDYGWSTWHKDLGAGYGIWLHATNARNAAMWDGDSNHSSTVFSPADSAYNNVSGSDYINYLFTSVEGYSKFGTYTGNGSTDGTFVYTGFRPAFVMAKRIDSTGSWYIFDNTRAPFNETEPYLLANVTNVEATDLGWDLLSNGFKHRTGYIEQNTSGGSYIYMAFAETPFKYANAR